jgi:hypothetical protein
VGVRVWTVEEANAALARVGRLVEEIRAARARLRSTSPDGRSGSDGRSRADPREPVRRALEELTSEGIVLRDPERGLVDFPAVSPSGRRYWLCWVLGEPEVAWWHWEHAGFADRRPLTAPPA